MLGALGVCLSPYKIRYFIVWITSPETPLSLPNAHTVFTLCFAAFQFVTLEPPQQSQVLSFLKAPLSAWLIPNVFLDPSVGIYTFLF